jgi:hypothetical protein
LCHHQRNLDLDHGQRGQVQRSRGDAIECIQPNVRDADTDGSIACILSLKKPVPEHR